jgi:uncharacterized protein YfaS (alpha-2-macroglobulin family)
LNITWNDTPVEATIGKPITQQWVGPDWSDLASPQNFRNQSTKPVYYTLSVNAVPRKKQPTVTNGFTVKRTFFTREGKPVDLNNIHVNDMLVAVIEGKATERSITEQVLLVDLLPAGFELESAQFGQGQNVKEFAWIDDLTGTEYQEMRDDRYIAAFSPSRSDYTFRFAYAVRAVTKGVYTLPGTAIEAMYQPQFHAFVTPEILTIKE